jgi:hypothetical protein
MKTLTGIVPAAKENEMTDKREVLKQIGVLLDQAQKLVWEAESIADEHDLGFTMNLGGYGMGGYYVPASEVDEDDRDHHGLDEGQSFWRASSQNC